MKILGGDSGVIEWAWLVDRIIGEIEYARSYGNIFCIDSERGNAGKKYSDLYKTVLSTFHCRWTKRIWSILFNFIYRRVATNTSALKLFKHIFPITAVPFPNESTNKYLSIVTRVQQREMMHGDEESYWRKSRTDPFTIDYKREGQERTKGETKDGEKAWSQS